MPTVSYLDLVTALRKLGISSKPVIAHASLSAFGEVQGGTKALLSALLDTVSALVVPTFTYKTMVTPEVGPPNNGLTYSRDRDTNQTVETFRPTMPADPLMGIMPEMLRREKSTKRTFHPILSFAGVKAEKALDTQTLYNPLAPIGALEEQDGWVLLIGVDHTVNTSIHYGEKSAGRRQFVRWALTPKRIVECPGFPGCSRGFNAIAPYLERVTQRARVGNAQLQAIQLRALIENVIEIIKKDPLALLCQQEDCERCNAIRTS